MKVTRLEIPDILVIEPQVFKDQRGFFYESYRKDVLVQNGIQAEFVQDNHSLSQKGVLRGLHYQIQPKAQTKLVQVLRGSIFDVAVDIRKSSKTFGHHISLTIRAEDKKSLLIPSGFAHGFLVLEDNTEVVYKVTDYYSPQHECGIIWNDPKLKIAWPSINASCQLSEKDKVHPVFEKAVFFS